MRAAFQVCIFIQAAQLIYFLLCAFLCFNPCLDLAKKIWYVFLLLSASLNSIFSTRYKGNRDGSLDVDARRFAYPSRLCDLVPLFGRAEQELSQRLNTVCTDNLCMVSIPSPLHGMQSHLSLDRRRHTYSFLPPPQEFRLGMDGSRNLFSSYPCQRFSLDPMLWDH